MTQLEYLICESERCGDIDLYTRDTLLEIMERGSAVNKQKEVDISKYKEEYDEKIKELTTELSKLTKYHKTLTDGLRTSNNLPEDKQTVQEKKHRDTLRKEIDKIDRKISSVSNEMSKTKQLYSRKMSHAKKYNDMLYHKKQMKSEGKDIARKIANAPTEDD